ncbi:hypothetical protein EU528_12565 [Candidatus Thorarchaeota archaeon]|nr:MAG: hypothetical protein EU528_12565 [Candidatus Thorarchaeota archaeon]
MTFLIDPALLILFSLVSCGIGYSVRNKTSLPVGKMLSILCLCVILFTSTSLYLNLWYMDWFWQPFAPLVTSGKDLMINSGIFHFESTNTAGLTDTLAAIQIILYPLWTFIGIRIWSYHKK